MSNESEDIHLTVEEPTDSYVIPSGEQIRVFVSSTMKELAPERQAISKAIGEMRLKPVLFEDGSKPHAPQLWYREQIRSCQIFVGIYGESYGWVVPDTDISGIHEEWNLASPYKKCIAYTKKGGKRDPRLDALIEKIQEKVVTVEYETPEQLAKLVSNDLQGVINDIVLRREEKADSPDYYASLQKKTKEYKAIPRTELAEALSAELKLHNKLQVIGPPGIGKSFLVAQVPEQRHIVYISLAGRSPLSVVSHIANVLRPQCGLSARQFTSESEAFSALEGVAGKNNCLIVYDNVDQNPALARTLAELDHGGCGVLFVARSESILATTPMARFDVPRLSKSEIKCVIEAYDIRLDDELLDELDNVSGGNPLYLFYFAQHQISPLPQGLKAYQIALIEGRDPEVRELLNLAAMSHDPRTVLELGELLNMLDGKQRSPMELEDLLAASKPLLEVVGQRVEPFHPYFAEFLRDHVSELGYAEYYDKVLGEAAYLHEEAVQAAYHLSVVGDDRAKDFLADAAHISMVRGDSEIAIQFARDYANSSVEVPEDEVRARMMLCEYLSTTGKKDEARSEIKRAQDVIVKAGLEQNIRFFESYVLTLDLEFKNANESIRIAKNLVNEFPEGSHARAASIVNLSYIYINTQHYREAADTAEQAYNMFDILNVDHGRLVALTNLGAALNLLEDYDRLKSISNQVMSLVKKVGDQRIKCAALNMLAKVYRQDDQPAKARELLEECISICKRSGYVEQRYSNTVNLGNTYRDENNLDEAKGCYHKALNGAREHGIPKVEAHALELLASVAEEEKMYALSLEYADSALSILKVSGERQRFAGTWRIIAKVHNAQNNKLECANAWSKSAKYCAELGQLEDATTRFQCAARSHVALGMENEAVECLILGAGTAESALDFRMVVNESHTAPTNLASTLLLRTLDEMLTRDNPPYFSGLAMNIAMFAKRNVLSGGVALYREAVRRLVGHVDVTRHHVLLALAIMIDQGSPDVLPTELLEEIENTLIALPGLRSSRDDNDEYSWTIGLCYKTPTVVQFLTIGNEHLPRRMSLCLSLILLGAASLMRDRLALIGNQVNDGMTFMITTTKEFERKIGKIANDMTSEKDPIENEIAMVRILNDKQISGLGNAIVIFPDDFDIKSDWSVFEGNKSFLFVLMNLHCVLVSQLFGISREQYFKLSKDVGWHSMCDLALKGLFE